MRQTEILLAQADQMRRQDHAAGVPGPVVDIECGVVFGKVRIAAIAEDGFHKIEIADQAGRREEADFHRLFRLRPSGGTDQRAQQQRTNSRTWSS